MQSLSESLYSCFMCVSATSQTQILNIRARSSKSIGRFMLIYKFLERNDFCSSITSSWKQSVCIWLLQCTLLALQPQQTKFRLALQQRFGSALNASTLDIELQNISFFPFKWVVSPTGSVLSVSQNGNRNSERESCFAETGNATVSTVLKSIKQHAGAADSKPAPRWHASTTRSVCHKHPFANSYTIFLTLVFVCRTNGVCLLSHQKTITFARTSSDSLQDSPWLESCSR